jgi:hypothetical protein
MATTFDSLSAADRADFSQRLALYGLNETSVLQSDLFIPPNTTVTLSASPGSFLQAYILTTQDVNELKRWIGTPNRYFEKGDIKNPYHSAKAIEATVRKYQDVATPSAIGSKLDLEEIHAGAIAYIWGDSNKVKDLKPILDRVFGRYQVIFWPFFTITVSRGSVLELGPGANVLFAWKIIIEEGGEVRGNGTNLTVQCTILQKKNSVLPPFGDNPVRVAPNL